MAAHWNLRQTVQFYMVDFQTPLGKAIDIFIITLNLIYVALFIIDTYPISLGMRFILWRVELVIVGIFIVEYFLRLYGATDRWAFIKDIYSIIDVASILPPIILLALPISFFFYDIRFIESIRILAVLRIFRFLRFIAEDHLLFGIISLEMLNVARLVVIIIIIFFVYSGLFYFVESPVNPAIQNFGNAFYFTVVAVSTVGFGDIVPVSDLGRLVTIAMIISGIILIPLQAARIFREWLNVSEKKVLVCPGCGVGRHDKDADYCRKCGEELKQRPNDPRS
ncbi:MAG: ion transporter [Methanotrichaceae archaeon]|nr:ion transporter [Methanotrichaceae archaeon]